MLERNYSLKQEKIYARDAIVVSGLGEYDLSDTMECGQCFRHLRIFGGRGYTESARDAELVRSLADESPSISEYESGYVEYITVAHNKVIRVGQRRRGELIFYGLGEDEIRGDVGRYFSLNKGFDAVREVIKARTDSDLLRTLADASSGIALLTQQPWECVFSFIISQNNNIPRIRKIIRNICLRYGENLSLKAGVCPITDGPICEQRCQGCGACYSFPTKDAVLADGGEGIAAARVGFRHRYIMSLCELVSSGEVDLDKIAERHELSYTLSELCKIVGVGEKVASCAALFAFENYDAFPVDVWIRRALDTYFEGKLNIATLGEYAGIAQQYIFHGIRNIGR